MNVVCPKCKKVILLSPQKMPFDKEKAMINCPSCSQGIIFAVPRMNVAPMVPVEDRTVVDQTPVQQDSKSNLPIIIDKATGIEYPLKLGKNILGRKSDICLDDPFLSRMHCCIEVMAEKDAFTAILCDDGSIAENGLPSTNGTFYNGVRLTKFDKIILKKSDEVRIGRTVLALK